ncbi:MAG TPA: VWA domain-containing protein [Pyrinomonadaceae bacterium]|nr:VWA domain-containing protein [Pyrinomonadaceae bacterium]
MKTLKVVKARLASALVVSLLLAATPCVSTARAAQSVEGGGQSFLNIALPPSGEMLVENRRGSVRVEVWAEDHVALAADVQGAGRARGRGLPVAVSHTETLLTIKVTDAAPAAALARRTLKAGARRMSKAVVPRVDLILRVPASARMKVYTSDGALEIRGLPASLVAQTISGDLTLALPAGSEANLTAQSLNGAVTLGEGVESEGAGGRVVRGKFQARLGAGGSPGAGSRTVNLFSGRGHISLTTLSAEAGDATAERGNQDTPERVRGRDAGRSTGQDSSRVAANRARVKDAPEETPLTPARRPTPQPAETPQEVGEDEVVRVESDLVTVNVSVVDRASGRGLVGLSAGDFKVFEDGVEQHVEHFESADAPFDLLLLLDLSGSTARVTDTIRAAARRFVAATRAQDRVAIVTFAGEQSVVSPPTSDRAALANAIDRIATPKGDTRLYDSLDFALGYMTRNADPARRRAVILMSDGLDSTLPNVTGVGSTLPYNELRSRVQEFDGIVYTIWTSTEYEAFSPEDIQPETFDLAHDRLEELAGAGGGAFYEVEKLEDLAGAYERVVADLGTVYSLSYRPTNKQRDGSWRAIRITLPRRSNAVARGRRGYFAK